MFEKNEYFGQKFKDLLAEKIKLKAIQFEKCQFIGCNFIEVCFDSLDFLDCEFVDSVFTNTKVPDCEFSEVSFKNCKMIGFDWTGAKSIHDLEFSLCQLNYSNFTSVDARKIKMKESSAEECIFTETNLSEGSLEGSDFKGARFFKTDLTECNLLGAKNYFIDLSTNKITKAKFSYPEVMNLLSSLDIEIEY